MSPQVMKKAQNRQRRQTPSTRQEEPNLPIDEEEIYYCDEVKLRLFNEESPLQESPLDKLFNFTLDEV